MDGVVISAAPILHRCPTVGYVFDEPATASTSATPEMLSALNANADALLKEQNVKNPKSLLGKILKQRQAVRLPDGTLLEPPALDKRGRRVVVLGDTYDATAGLDRIEIGINADGGVHRGMLGLAQDVDLLIHECTNAALPGPLQQGNKKVDEKRDEVRAKALLRGHSTPQVAGLFAGRCGAKQLLLNHLSIKYPAPSFRAAQEYADNIDGLPRDEFERRYLAISEIQRQATESWHENLSDSQGVHVQSAKGRRAIAAYDGFFYRVLRIEEEEDNIDSSEGVTTQQDNSIDESASASVSHISNKPYHRPQRGALHERGHFARGRVFRSRGRGLYHTTRGASRNGTFPTSSRSRGRNPFGTDDQQT